MPIPLLRSFGSLCFLLLATTSLLAADSLIDASRRRQDKVKTLQVTLDITEFIAKGSISESNKGMTSHLIPKEDTTLRSSGNKLVISGEMARIELYHPIWNMVDGKPTEKPLIQASNDELGKEFFPKGIGGSEQLQGIIKKGPVVDAAKMHLFTPLTFFARPLDPSLCPYELERMKPTGIKQMVDGIQCEEYSYSLTPSLTISLWVNPPEGYSIRRLQKIRSGKIIQNTQIQYHLHETFGLLPNKWKISHFDSSGRTTSVLDVTVANVSFNQAIDPKVFEITFPEGCIVHDLATMKDYRVLADGRMRELTPLGADTDIVIDQPGTPFFQRNANWIYVAIVVTILVFLGMLLWRRSQSSSRRNAASLVETIIVIAIIAVLLALLLPAIQRVRESAARQSCAHRLRQLALACHQYHDTHQHFPAGCDYVFARWPQDFVSHCGISWLTSILPFIDQQALWARTWEAYRHDPLANSAEHEELHFTIIPLFICPSDGRTRGGGPPYPRYALTSYQGVSGTDYISQDGIFHKFTGVSVGDISDGTSTTVMIGERPPGPNGIRGCWYSRWGSCVCSSSQLLPAGYRSLDLPGGCKLGRSLRPGRLDDDCSSGHYWSLHPNGTNFAFADGSVRFLTYNLGNLLPTLATRAGGEVVALE